MIPSLAATVMIESAEDSVLAIQSSTVVCFLFSFIFGPAILYLIQMLGAIQIIMHIPLMSIQVASNATNFYKLLIPYRLATCHESINKLLLQNLH